jgi:hypothetical protein
MRATAPTGQRYQTAVDHSVATGVADMSPASRLRQTARANSDQENSTEGATPAPNTPFVFGAA